MTDTASAALDRCRARGVRRAEAFVKTGQARTVALDPAGRVSWTRTAEGGIGLRVFLDHGATGFASCCGVRLGDAALDHLVAAAVDAARAPDAVHALPREAGGTGRGLGIFDPRLNAATPTDLEGLLDDAAREALRSDPRVRRLDGATLSASSSTVRLRNSEGFAGEYRQTLVHLAIGVVAEDAGRRARLRPSRTARNLSALSAVLFADHAARLAAATLEARAPRPGTFPAVLSPAAAVEVLRALARSIRDNHPAPGTPVASARLTVIDDGHLPGGTASAPFDGEGVPTRRTVVVSKGRFEAGIHDLASAARHGTVSTGNGVRMSFRDAPARANTNLFIVPGGDDPADLMAGVSDGVRIDTLRPTRALRGNGATFTGIATGRRIVGGKTAEAMSGALLVVPLADLLQGVEGVGNDLTFGFPGGAFGAPSILVREVDLRAPWS